MSPAQKRLWRISLLAIAAVLVVALVVIVDEFLWWLPARPRNHPVEYACLALALAYFAAKRLDPARTDGLAIHAGPITRLALFDQLAAHALQFLTPLLCLVIAAAFVTWAPHYLVWPLWTDHDHVLAMARGWDLGRLPWRDLLTYQFPGEIELAWLIGRLLGWDNPIGFYLADLALLSAFATLIWAWGKRQSLPVAAILLAILTFLGFAVSRPFTLAAQRDTHATILSIGPILVLSAWPNRRAIAVASGILFALALAVRPQAVLLFPALAYAAFTPRAASEAASAEPHRRNGRPVFFRVLAGVAFGLAIAVVPVVASGLWPDFLRMLKFPISQPGAYSAWAPSDLLKALRETVAETRNPIIIVALAAMSIAADSIERRRLARLALLALSGGLAYRLAHPVDQLYLRHPAEIITCWAIAILAAWLLSDPRFKPIPRALLLFLILVDFIPWTTNACSPQASIDAVVALAQNKPPALTPPGAEPAYPNVGFRIYHYEWADLNAALAFIRKTTSPTTPVANLLSHFPYPAINGSTGRPLAIPIESVPLLSWYPQTDFDSAISRALESAEPGTLVVWDGTRAEPAIAARLPKTIAAIHAQFQPVAQFGEIEIRIRRQSQ